MKKYLIVVCSLLSSVGCSHLRIVGADTVHNTVTIEGKRVTQSELDNFAVSYCKGPAKLFTIDEGDSGLHSYIYGNARDSAPVRNKGRRLTYTYSCMNPTDSHTFLPKSSVGLIHE